MSLLPVRIPLSWSRSDGVLSSYNQTVRGFYQLTRIGGWAKLGADRTPSEYLRNIEQPRAFQDNDSVGNIQRMVRQVMLDDA